MNFGFKCSLFMHAALLAMLLVGIPIMHHDVNTDYAVVAEVVPISEFTNIKVATADKVREELKESKKAPKSAQEDVPQEEKKEAAKDVKAEEVEAEKIPTKNKKEEKKKKDEKKKPYAKKDTKVDDKKKPKKKDDNFEKSILKSLEEDVKKREQDNKDKESTDKEKALKGDTNKEYNSNLPMSLSEIDGIKNQITSRWNTTSFSGAAEMGMQVVVHIELDMDGNVLSATPKTQIGNNSPYYQAFVDSAVRAVRAASPIQHLTKEKYHSWKEIEFRFDSSGMIY